MLPPSLKPDGLQLPGATPAQIAQCQADAGVTFPDDLQAFLTESNGYDGDAGLGYLMLWSTEELGPLILGYNREPSDDMAGVFYIGSNGGPTAYAVDWSSGAPAYVSVPFVPGTREEVRVLGSSFAEFIRAVAAGEGW